jgi:hypothetical protein
MSHAGKAAAKAAGAVLTALGHLGWPVLCVIGVLAVAGTALIIWVLSDQARSDRAAALLTAWRGINRQGPEPAEIDQDQAAGTLGS